RIDKRGTDGGRHENLTDLKRLKKEFDELVEAAGDSGVEVFKINTNDKSVNEVVAVIENLIERKMLSVATD
ncbi:MAG: hypothetical protein WCH75_01580, partial [Candidatus Binatia bacterium]